MLVIRNFQVEGMEKSCVTDERHPQFSWYVESDRNGAEVVDSMLSVGTWSIRSGREMAAVYGGPELDPFSAYQAKLVVTDDQGEHASAILQFETGRLELPWKGSWITDGRYHFREKKKSPRPMYFRRNIALHGAGVKRARLYTTAMGIYQFYLNGERVQDDYFAPGFTSYRHHLQYQSYDLTETLQRCQNLAVRENQDAERNESRPVELTCTVAGGWAVGRFTYKNRNRIYVDRQALLAEVHIWYEDGSEQVIGTDQSWQVTMHGQMTAAEFYAGEVFDATIDPGEADWHAAAIEKLRIHPKIEAAVGAPVRAHEIFRPVQVLQSPSGVTIYDMGQNFAGVIRAHIHGAVAGQKITFTHAEVLMDGELYRKPLRSAKQEAVYICREGDQQYSPTMTYMGFRYVGVTGIDQEQLTLEGVALYSDIQVHGSFHCSDDRLNQLQSNICWGAKSNFVDIPTDCPQRDERLGWTGDIALFSRTAVWNFDMRRFLKKWLRDLRSDQVKGGGIPMIIPDIRLYWQMELVFPMAVDHWGDACILVPWAEYLNTGDRGILENMYPTMQRYLKACSFWAGLFSVGRHRYIWKLLHHYGDWLAPGVSMWGWMRRGKYTATASLAHCSALMARISDILGKSGEADAYRELHRRASDAYCSILMDADGKLRGKEEFQTGYVLPLYYDMLPDGLRKKAAANLSHLVRENHWHIGTGFPGTPYILFALADNGCQEDAFRMLMEDTCPSWLYEVKTGGTTIWERWDALREDGTCNTGDEDGTGGMVSFNHYASGAVGDFLYRRIAGIEALEGGYRSFRIEPHPGGGLTEAEGSVICRYGEIRSSWKITDGRFHITVHVPVGTGCQLKLPDGTQKTLKSGTYSFCCEG